MTITERKLAIALEDLRRARALARGAGAPYAAIAIQRAIKSTEGAKNHARGRATRGSKHQPRRVARPRKQIDPATAAALVDAIKNSRAIRAIVAQLDGQEWSPDTLEEIADILRGADYEIREPNEGDDEK